MTSYQIANAALKELAPTLAKESGVRELLNFAKRHQNQSIEKAEKALQALKVQVSWRVQGHYHGVDLYSLHCALDEAIDRLYGDC